MLQGYVVRCIQQWVGAILLILFASTLSHSQTPTGGDPKPLPRDLSEFEGVYHYRDGGRLVLMVDAERLVAVIREAKYPLRAGVRDTFTNASNDRIPFLRDPAGRITGFQEHGDTFPRVSTAIDPELRRLLLPRPLGPDGRAKPYRYQQPPALTDGIRVDAMGPGTLACAVAEQVINGVLDGTYPEVHAVAVQHKGALVLEEYF